MKPCIGCKQTKPLNDFYRHSKMADGHINRCKVCARIAAVKNRLEKSDYYKAADRLRSDAPHRVAARKKNAERRRANPALAAQDLVAKRGWLARNQEKRAAHVALNNALRNGKLERNPCEICGTIRRVHAHHHDYSRPLDVFWLCTECHGLTHRVENSIMRLSERFLK